MAPTIISARRAARATALGALAVALVTGCGSASDEGGDTAPPADDPGTSQEGDGASESDGGGDGATSEESADEGTDTAPSDGGGTTAEGGEQPLPADADLATTELPITAEQAVEIGREEAGGGDLVQIEIDHDDRAWEWELEIVDGGTEHQFDIDATTGEITEYETDDEEDQDPAVDVASPMTYAEAMEIALGQEPGRVSGWELGSDDGTIRYQVDIDREGGGDVEVEVDVDTGAVSVDD